MLYDSLKNASQKSVVKHSNQSTFLKDCTVQSSVYCQLNKYFTRNHESVKISFRCLISNEDQSLKFPLFNRNLTWMYTLQQELKAWVTCLRVSARRRPMSPFHRLSN